MTEFRTKQNRLRELLSARQLDAIHLKRTSSFAWATCGAASYVNIASTTGAASLLITPEEHFLISNNIEASRLEQEEQLHFQGWSFQIYPWYEVNNLLPKLVGSGKVGSDNPIAGEVDLTAEISHLRCALLPEENIRFRVLSRLCAESMDAAIRSVKPGMSEHQAASLLVAQTQQRGIQSIVNLVAADERIFHFRHPLPTFNPIENYLMLVLVGRRWGLTCSITRLVYFGQIPEPIRLKSEALAKIDATMIDSSRPETAMSQVFKAAQAAYAEYGYPNEWQNHHQGGPTAYETREFLVNANTPDIIQPGMIFAWNPSITGVKSEDTIEINANGIEILTEIKDWPMIEVEVGERIYQRPAILELND